MAIIPIIICVSLAGNTKRTIVERALRSRLLLASLTVFFLAFCRAVRLAAGRTGIHLLLAELVSQIFKREILCALVEYCCDITNGGVHAGNCFFLSFVCLQNVLSFRC